MTSQITQLVTTYGVTFAYFIDAVKCHYDIQDTPEVDLSDEDIDFFIDAYHSALKYRDEITDNDALVKYAQTLRGITEILRSNKRLASTYRHDYFIVLDSIIDIQKEFSVPALVVNSMRSDFNTSNKERLDGECNSAKLRGDSLYIIDFDGTIKVGRSMHPSKRIRTVSTSSGREIKAAYIAVGAGDSERRVHGLLNAYRSVGEFFNCSIDYALQKIDHLKLELIEH